MLSSTLGTFPEDILLAVFQVLCSWPKELYAPLICSHVCAHWRRTVVHAPLLWQYIDTSRGERLTHLWLERSRNTLLDVRLWENPLDYHLTHTMKRILPPNLSFPKSDAAIFPVQQESHRWRSLDIAFCNILHIQQILEFLANKPGIMRLNSLTIGPMGSKVVTPSDEYIFGGSSFTSLDTTTQLLYQRLNVECKALYVDTCPIFSSSLTSPLLTTLEVYTGNYSSNTVVLDDWLQILSHTPNLVQLKLVGFDQKWCYHVPHLPKLDSREFKVQLLSLEWLELSGAFLWIVDLFEQTVFPKLTYILLSHPDPYTSVSAQLKMLATRSQSLRQLQITSSSTGWRWAEIPMPSLEEVTFCEMGWSGVHTLMQEFNLSRFSNLKHVRLERVWDLDGDSPMLHHPALFSLPPIELVDCMCPTKTDRTAVDGDWYGEAESYIEGSTFSENSAFFPCEGDCASSEETGSDESPRSYGESEGSGSARISPLRRHSFRVLSRLRYAYSE